MWEEEPDRLLRPGLEGMLPLLPLMKGAKQTRDETIGTMIEGLRTAGKDDILALGYTFAGLVYQTRDDKQWLKRRFAMFHDILEDSWVYQEIVQKGIDQGREQEKLTAARSFLTRIIEKHFPQLLSLAQQKAEQIKSVDTLNSAIDKLLEVQTMEQARQVLEEISQ
jgi:hypothetical protein